MRGDRCEGAGAKGTGVTGQVGGDRCGETVGRGQVRGRMQGGAGWDIRTYCVFLGGAGAGDELRSPGH